MSHYDILLTYAWVRSTYVASRSLSSLGLNVCVADEGKIGMCQWSNKSKFVGIYRSPLSDPENFISDIVRLVEKTDVNILLPSHDETEVIAKYREKLPKNLIIPIASYESINKANDKSKMIDVAVKLGVPIPKTLDWSSLIDLQHKLDTVNWKKFVVKLRKGNSSKGVFYPPSKHEVIEKTSSLCKQYNLSSDRLPIIQERVDGDGWGVSCLYWEGERIAFFTHKRLKEKITTGGTSTSRVSIRNPILEKYAFRILDEMNWHGLAMIEFKYNEETKEAWFIEVNPRLWGSLHLAISSGVNFPALLYTAATISMEEAKKLSKTQEEGVIARWYMGDIIIAATELFSLHPVKAFKSILPGNCDTYDDIHLDDLGAFAGEITGYLSSFVKSKSLNPEKEGMLG